VFSSLFLRRSVGQSRRGTATALLASKFKCLRHPSSKGDADAAETADQADCPWRTDASSTGAKGNVFRGARGGFSPPGAIRPIRCIRRIRMSFEPGCPARARVLRPVRYTVAPAAPSSTAMPRPAPRVAPATRATFPFSGRVIAVRGLSRVHHRCRSRGLPYARECFARYRGQFQRHKIAVRRRAFLRALYRPLWEGACET
jgi:hypothetical protein